MEPNVLNGVIPNGGGLSIGTVENNKTNEGRAASDDAAPSEVATPNASAAEATLSLSVVAAISDTIAAEYISNEPDAETPKTNRRFSYSNKRLMTDKRFCGISMRIYLRMLLVCLKRI